MPDWIIFLFHDAKKGWDELRPTDFAQPSFLALWAVMILMPLAGADRRSGIAGLVYMLFCVAAGAILGFALPKEYVSAPSIQTQLTTLLVMAGIAGLRWFYQFGGPKVTVKVPTKGDGNGKG